MLSKVLLLVLVMVTLTQAFYTGFHGSSNGRTSYVARCRSSNTPCRLKVDMTYRNGTSAGTSSSLQCSCNSYEGTCSNDWSQTSKAITRNLRSSTMNVHLQMMFCSAVTPAQVCSNNQVALEVSGTLLIPNNLESYACRCEDNQPLRIVHRRVENFKFFEKYVCNSSWNACGANSRCMTVTRSNTQYHCQCGSDQVCTPPTWTRNTIEQIVYCSSAPNSSS